VSGKRIGFTVTGDIKIYETEPQQPPSEKPHGYGITFTPFDPAASSPKDLNRPEFVYGVQKVVRRNRAARQFIEEFRLLRHEQVAELVER
jgi:hypothetical protein